MPCCISCAVSAVFLIGMVYMTYATYQSGIIVEYQKQLPIELQKTYQNIVDERTRIYYFGYILGFILSLFVIFYNVRVRKNRFSTTSLVCIVVAISFLTNYFYYILSPKSDWMLNHIKTPEQTKAWLIMYKGMQYYYHSGLVLGLLAVGFFAFSFRSSEK
jgi:ABC-type Fe3+-siderophore transport system permease subunit